MEEFLKRPHPAMVHFPITLYPLSLLFLIIYGLHHEPFYLAASFWAFMFGAASIFPVAATGWMDMSRLENVPEQGKRLMHVHLTNGMSIVGISVIAIFLFLWRPPFHDAAIMPLYSTVLAILSLMVLAQGYIGGKMVYHYQLGVDGDTR